MRIGLVYRSFHRSGSLARSTVELARHLSGRHEVHVFSIGRRTEHTLAPDCIFHDVPVSRLGDGTRFSARELGSFAHNSARLLTRESFDVVHACAPSTWTTDVLKLPGVAREEARLQGAASWRYTASALRHPGDAVRELLERKALAYPGLRRIHVEAESVRDALWQRYGIGPEDVLVLPPAVNLAEFSPPTDKTAARIDAQIQDPAALVVLFCGSDYERKGLDRAIRALAQLTSSAALLVVGGGPQPPYRRLAAELGVEDRVHFVGLRSDAWRFYHAADIFVLPTRADIWGVTAVEAMACGVPPIVSSAAGAASAIRDGEDGVVLAEPVDITALAAAVDRLARDAELRATMGEKGIKAAKKYAWSERGRLVEEDLVAVAERRDQRVRRHRGRRRARPRSGEDRGGVPMDETGGSTSGTP